MRLTHTRTWTRALAALTIAALASLAFACGGGGGGGGGGMTTPGCATFNAGGTPAAGNVVLQDTANSTCNLVVVDLVITDVTNVFAVSFTLNYNASQLRYDGYSISSTLLNSDGNNVQEVENAAAGAVSLGFTRTGNTGVNATGTQRLVRLTFTRLANSGNSALTFSNNQVFDNQTPPQPKGGITWAGGTVSIN